MKMKNSILVMIAILAGSLASCESEVLNSYPDDDNGETTVSFVLTTGAVATKAAGDNYEGSDGTYTSATEDELSIKKVFIAVLDASTSDTTIRSSFVKSGVELTPHELTADKSESPESNNLQKAYKISGLSIAPGTYKFFAIANSTIADNDLLTCKSYKELTALVEENKANGANTAVFDPEVLVKVSELIEDEISDKDGGSGVSVVTIPLIQLAAKVQLNLKNLMPTTELTGETEVTFDPSEADLELWDWSVINSFSAKDLHEYIPEDGNSAGKTYWVKMCKCNNSLQSDLYGKLWYYDYSDNEPKIVPHTAKVVHIKADDGTSMTVDSIFYETNWELLINSVVVNNVETKTAIILNNEDACTNPGKVLRSNTIVETTDAKISVLDEDYILTFYTYEKPYYADESNEDILRIELGTHIVQKKKKITRRYSIESTHGVFVSTGGEIVEGFGNGARYQYAHVAGELDTDGSSETFVDMKGITIQKTFSIPVNPNEEMDDCNTDGLIHGNIYVLNATLNNVPDAAEIDLLWTVVPWGEPEVVDIPAFN